MDTAPTKKKTTPVAIGLILDTSDRILMTLRKAGTTRGSLWEIPGGCLEPQDHGSYQNALVRELEEELAIQVHVGDLVAQTILPLEQQFHINCFAAQIVKGDPRPVVADAMEWISIEEAIRFRPCVPSTYLFYKAIVQYLARRKP